MGLEVEPLLDKSCWNVMNCDVVTTNYCTAWILAYDYEPESPVASKASLQLVSFQGMKEVTFHEVAKVVCAIYGTLVKPINILHHHSNT